MKVANLFSFFRRDTKVRGRSTRSMSRSMRLEQLECRTQPSTFSVLNLDDSGTGSLRQAIIDANDAGGADDIDFQITGTIQLESALPALIDQVSILGNTAPGFVDVPLVAVDFNGFAGFEFGVGANGSELRALALINAAGAGATIDGANNTIIAGNFIGLDLDGTTVAANSGHGIELKASTGNLIGGDVDIDRNVISGNGGHGILLSNGSANNQITGNSIGLASDGVTERGNALDGVRLENSNDNLIGQFDPITGISYYDADDVPTQPVTAWQGIRESDTPNQYIIVGTSGDDGLLFDGTIEGQGTTHLVNFPGAESTSVYGPDNLEGPAIRLVGSYKNPDAQTAEVKVHGFLYEGTTAGLSNADNYRTIAAPGAEFTYVHSTMEGLAVGNYDSAAAHGTHGLPLGPGHAFLYDIATNTFLTDIVFPGSLSNTAYGIWYNGRNSYTIAGGWSPDAVNNLENPGVPIGQAFLVDYNSDTGEFQNWTTFVSPNPNHVLSHFEGISGVEKGVYTLSADSVIDSAGDPVQGSFVTVRRNPDRTFAEPIWIDLEYPGVDPSDSVASSNSVYGNQVVGVVIGPSTFSFQASINVGFQLSNVISGNGGNGITLHGSDNNTVAMNFIGTDFTGMVDVGNDGDGVLITAASSSNLIGGEATGGNDPTDSVFIRPPQGNLISGNQGNGVLINDAATANRLAGNFIGTNVTGNAALGNTLDGVAIVNADGNELLGCTFQQDPFVFYNVVSGNLGNGLRVTDSDDTTIHANFFGVGADNTTDVGNGLDGVLINGTSANTQFGGVIPLGNVVAGNSGNGVVIADSASGVLAFNTFSGLPAFQDIAIPNDLNGFVISSSGGNNVLRTNVFSGNGLNGVYITGNATGVQITEAIIGMNTDGKVPLPNGANGILIDGNAHDNLIGGEQASVIPRNIVSGNVGHGIAIMGNAANNVVFNNYIGLQVEGIEEYGNGGSGVYIGENATANIIGGDEADERNIISGNDGDGIELAGSSTGTVIIGNYIGTNPDATVAFGNAGNGITITTSGNHVGGTAAGEGNLIAFNVNGIEVDAGTGNSIRANSIYSNTALGISLINDGNLNQSAPVLTGAYQPTATTIAVSGMVFGTPDTSYAIDVFASLSDSPSAQGQSFLGTVTVQTNAVGAGTFVVNAPYTSSLGEFLTATATSPADNTSEFSPAITQSGNANTIFVTSTYGLLLNRAPDPGASGWVTALDGGATPESVLLGIQASNEYLSNQIEAMYLRYLDRTPDPTGAQYYLSQLQAGATFEQVAAGLASSNEYFSLNGGSNEGFLLGLYEDVLGRAPSDSELNYWLDQLNSGATRNEVALGFLTSTEYRTDLIQDNYDVFLGQPASSDNIEFWLAEFQAGATDQDVLAAIFGSPEGYDKWS